MTRKGGSKPFETVLDAVARLPWWAGVALAVGSYVLLHWMATPIQVTQSAKVGALMAQSVVSGLATAGQYLVPLLCLMGAALSVWRRKQRAGLNQDVAQAQSAKALNGVSWREFEKLVGEAYRLQGFRVAETGSGSADGGVDLALEKGGEKFLVQCKQWKALKVGVDVVRELYGVMAATGATGGFVVTSGRFTEDAKAFAQWRNVHLMDGPELLGMIKRAKQSLATNPKQPGAAAQVKSSGVVAGPACPQCGANMVKRTARKGARAGADFWGCTEFPTCRGVRALDAA